MNVRNVRNVVPCLTIVIITVVSEKELRGWHNEQTNAVKNAPCELFCSLSSLGHILLASYPSPKFILLSTLV